MNDQSFPRPFHLPEGRVLRGPVPPHFERFYRSALRFQSGSRVSTCEVARRYQAWAREVEAPSLNHRAVLKAMASIGHARRHSDGMFFADVALAEDVPAVDDNFPAPLTPTAALPILARLDAIAVEVAQLRAAVAAS